MLSILLGGGSGSGGVPPPKRPRHRRGKAQQQSEEEERKKAEASKRKGKQQRLNYKDMPFPDYNIIRKNDWYTSEPRDPEYEDTWFWCAEQDFIMRDIYMSHCSFLFAPWAPLTWFTCGRSHTLQMHFRSLISLVLSLSWRHSATTVLP